MLWYSIHFAKVDKLKTRQGGCYQKEGAQTHQSIMATASPHHQCCNLAKHHDEENFKCLKNTLLLCIWKYFSVCEDQETPKSVQEHDVETVVSLLISASFAGCISALDFILDSFAVKSNANLSIKRLINSRLPINLPVPDTWIHKTVCLAVTPLHMACWRLDSTMIQKLLDLGADPNSLAWEKAGSTISGRNIGGAVIEGLSPMTGESLQEDIVSHILPGADQDFNTSLGLSPLHFIALGLRSPTRNSLTKGVENHLIHFASTKNDETFCNPNNFDCMSDLYPSNYEYKGEPSQMIPESYITSTCEAVAGCINALLSAGACPNIGQTDFLNFYFPLDVIVQPPIKIYYASNMARSTQTSESLRRQNFEANLHLITHACRTLYHGGGRLSDNFLSNHKWNLRLLDGFYTHNLHAVFSFIEFLIFAGIFPDSGKVVDLRNEDLDRCFETCTTNDLMKFMVDAINIPVRSGLIALILKWCSMNVLHHIIETGQAILTRSEYSLPCLEELINTATKEQLRPLKHLCKLVILRTLSFNLVNIKLLPLPPSLLRDLRVIRYM